MILDHHKTAFEMLSSGVSISGNVTKVIDMDRSGATIAYDYFKERLLGGDNNGSKDVAYAEFQRVRRLFEYIEDVDLWRWRLPNSKAFSSGLKDLNLEFDVTSNPTLFRQVASLQHILHKLVTYRYLNISKIDFDVSLSKEMHCFFLESDTPKEFS